MVLEVSLELIVIHEVSKTGGISDWAMVNDVDVIIGTEAFNGIVP